MVFHAFPMVFHAFPLAFLGFSPMEKPPRKTGSTFHRYRGATGEGDDRRPSAGQTPGDHPEDWENHGEILGIHGTQKKPPMANKSKKIIIIDVF